MTPQVARRCVALRHVAFEDLGLIESWLRQRGWHCQYVEVGTDGLNEIDLQRVDLLVVLGGPISVNDGAQFPWIADELRLIRTRLDSRLPMLGICLGAQLIARALGASVYRMARAEIGFLPVSLTQAARVSPFARLDDPIVLHWHGEQFDLPRGVDSLAVSACCPHQAFMLDHHVLAWQFHLEADPSRLEPWLIGHAVELQRADVLPSTLRTQARSHGAAMKKTLDVVLTDWFTQLRFLRA